MDVFLRHDHISNILFIFYFSVKLFYRHYTLEFFLTFHRLLLVLKTFTARKRKVSYIIEITKRLYHVAKEFFSETKKKCICCITRY
jgi:hypothetical protein